MFHFLSIILDKFSDLPDHSLVINQMQNILCYFEFSIFRLRKERESINVELLCFFPLLCAEIDIHIHLL